MKKISLILPVYNEIDRLPSTFDKILKWLNEKPRKFTIDINIIDDGSSDETINFVRNYKGFKKNILQKKHSGLMSTIIYAFEKIDSDFYIILAADLPVSLSFLDDLCQYLDEYDIIQGSRYFDHSIKNISHKRPLGRVILSTVLSILFQIFFKCKVKDPQIDFKIFSRRIVKEIVPNLKLEHDGLKMTEILVRAFTEDFKILEKKTDYNYINSNRAVPNINFRELHLFFHTAISCFFAFLKLVWIYRREFRNKNVKKNPLRFL